MKKTNKIICILILLGSIYFALAALKEKDIYQFLIIITVIPVSLLPYGMKKIGKVKVPGILECFYMLFIFFGYFLGSIMKWYGKIAYYDVIIHFTSGVLSAMVAYYIYKMFQKKEEVGITVLFILSITALVASAWEIFEFVCDKIFQKDAQNVLTSGVDDTMTDIIAAFLGSILYILLYIFQQKCKKGKIMKKYIQEVETCTQK